MSATSRSKSKHPGSRASAAEAPIPDIIEIPMKKSGCVVRTSHPVTLTHLNNYYDFASFHFIYNNPKKVLKKHYFVFHVGVVTPDNKQIFTKKLTYNDLRIRNDSDVLKFKARLEKMIKNYNHIKEWFFPVLEKIKSYYAMNILASAIKSIQFDTTSNGNIVPKPSNIDSAIESEITIRREIKSKGANLLVEFDQNFVNRATNTESAYPDTYHIYFTFQMKPDAEPYIKKRTITKYCISNEDGSSKETRYITQLLPEEHVSNDGDLPFRFSGGNRKTRRRQRHRRNRTAK